MRSVTFAVLSVLSCLWLTALPPQASANRTIFGQIKDSSGAPVAGLTVKAWDDDVDFGAKKDDDFMGQATTDAQGNYKIEYREGPWDPAPHNITTWRPDIYVVAFAASATKDLVKLQRSKTHKDHPLRDDLRINLVVPKAEVLTKRTAFDPAVHGFPFENLKTHTDSRWGACGGMCLVALRHFRNGRPIQTESTPQVRDAITRAQKETVLPGHWAKFIEWQGKPTLPHTSSPHTIGYSTKGEWPELLKKIDAGTPVILGVIRVQSAIVDDVEKNHQVLAIGYSYDTRTKDAEIYAYDPNYPKVTSTIRLNLGLPDNVIKARQATPCGDNQTCPGVVRGFFLIREGSAPI
jgi:hypothetical protein